MSAMEIEKEGSVALIHIKSSSLTADVMRQLMNALDEVERYDDVTCLVTTGHGKSYSTGLDIATTAPFIHDWDKMEQDMAILHKLLARLLSYPVPTVAAMNGHVFGGGVMLALTHDYRIMRSDRGWFCVPVARLQVRLPHASLIGLLKAKLPPNVLSQVLLGRRYTGSEAEAAGLVDESCPLPALRERAIAAASRLAGDGLDRDTVRVHKEDLYREILRALEDPVLLQLNPHL